EEEGKEKKGKEGSEGNRGEDGNEGFDYRPWTPRYQYIIFSPCFGFLLGFRSSVGSE
ncbi:Os09g0389500, partial [Oryza sativa Japonica Group]